METTNIQPGMLKPTLILTTLLFLLVAPAPDSNDIAEMTANFLAPSHQLGLMASEESLKAAEEEL